VIEIDEEAIGTFGIRGQDTTELPRILSIAVIAAEAESRVRETWVSMQILSTAEIQKAAIEFHANNRYRLVIQYPRRRSVVAWRTYTLKSLFEIGRPRA
jgi:hypothetical protein